MHTCTWIEISENVGEWFCYRTLIPPPLPNGRTEMFDIFFEAHCHELRIWSAHSMCSSEHPVTVEYRLLTCRLYSTPPGSYGKGTPLLSTRSTHWDNELFCCMYSESSSLQMLSPKMSLCWWSLYHPKQARNVFVKKNQKTLNP